MAMTEKYANSAGSGDADGSSEANAASFATMLTAAAAGERWNFKGNHELTGNATFTNAGSATAPIIIRGYKTTIGDLADDGRTNGNGPLITTDFPVINGTASYNLTLPTLAVMETMTVTSGRNAGALITGTYNVCYRVYAYNSGTGGSAVGLFLGAGAYAIDCDASLTGASGGSGAFANAGTGSAIGCRLTGGPAYGAVITGASSTFVGCTFLDCATNALHVQTANNAITVVNCTLVNSGYGLYLITGSTRVACVVNCLITDITNNGLHAVDAASGIFAVNNRYNRNGANSSGATEWLAAYSGFNNTTAVANATDEYVGPTASPKDFRLKSGTPGLSIGIPLYRDMGALQRVRDYPAVTKVYDDTVDGTAGTLTLPAEADVESGVTYGVGGTGSTGTLEAGGGTGGVFVTKQQGIGV